MLRCLTDEEALKVMREIHDGDYGNHSGGRSLAHKIWTQGYYWPKMQDTCKNYVQKCEKCQIHAHDYHSPAGNLNIIESPWPFAIWGMDIVGPLPAISRDGEEVNKFVLALTDYFTKWVEAIALPVVTHKDVIKFIKENILMRFGIPYAIIMDNGSQFTSGATKAFLDEQGINKKFSAPYYPQSNGQAESTNKTIMDNIKKKLLRKKEHWSRHLLQVLWAYRTTPRTSTGESPFAMAFGMEAVLPTEIYLPTSRTYMIETGDNFGVQYFDVDTVEGRRDMSRIRLEQYRQTWTRHYNKKVKPREFSVGDLVLRKVFSKTQHTGKFGDNYEGQYEISEVRFGGNYMLKELNGRPVDK